MKFWGFLSAPHLVDNYAKTVDERSHITEPACLGILEFANNLYRNKNLNPELEQVRGSQFAEKIVRLSEMQQTILSKLKTKMRFVFIFFRCGMFSLQVSETHLYQKLIRTRTNN